MVPLVHTRTHELRERLDLQDTVICEKPNLIMVYVDFGQLNIVPFGGSLKRPLKCAIRQLFVSTVQCVFPTFLEQVILESINV